MEHDNSEQEQQFIVLSKDRMVPVGQGTLAECRRQTQLAGVRPASLEVKKLEPLLPQSVLFKTDSPAVEKVRILHLFSGTDPFKKALADFPYCEELSIDVDDKLTADLHLDLGTVERSELLMLLRQRHFEQVDLVWASVPCTSYSRLKHSSCITSADRKKRRREMEESDVLVLKTFEIIQWVQPTLGWIMENPWTGELRHRAVMQQAGIPFVTLQADYCQYGFTYRKQTALFTNCERIELKQCREGNCESLMNWSTREHMRSYDQIPSAKKGRVPPALLRSILHQVLPDGHCPELDRMLPGQPTSGAVLRAGS